MRKLTHMLGAVLLLVACGKGGEEPTVRPETVPGVPQNVVLHGATETSLTFQWDAVKDAANYLWKLSQDGEEATAEGLGDDVLVGAAGSLPANAKFRISKTDELWAKLPGKVLTEQLPDGVSVVQSGTKWTLPKAGKVAYVRGTTEVDASKLLDNPSGLKLTYKAKDGSFKGSFKVYADNDGRLKATTVNVTGVMVGGKGYGTATIKNVGSVDITIE